jgi:hypothetical protein
MFTVSYKGWFIACYIDKPKCSVILPKGGHWCNAKSLLSAKRIISRDSQWVKDKTQ